MKEIYVEVITPDHAAYKGNATSVTIPGSMGSFQVLYNHAPLMSTIDVGTVKIAEPDGVVKVFAIGGGTVEVKDNKVLILAESFESPSEIDASRAMEAKNRAEERLTKKYLPEIDEVRAELALKRAVNRLKLSKI